VSIETSGSPTGRFGGCWGRIDRAREQLTQFGVVWQGYLDSRPHHFDVEFNDNGGGRLFLRRLSPIPPELSLLLGELLYQLRACLDNCIYQIAILDAGGLDPPPKAGSLQFPICSTPEAWAHQANRYTGLTTEHRVMLERIQPYNSERHDWNCLAILNELARIDRHRARHMVGLIPAKVRIHTELSVVDFAPTTTIVGDGGVIAEFTLAGWSPDQHQLDGVEVELEVEILEHTTRPWGTLAKRLSYVVRAVEEYTRDLAAHAMGEIDFDS
jgi:hypothetical protein